MTLAQQIMAELRGRKTLDALLGPAPDRDSGLPWVDLATQAAIEARIGELIEAEEMREILETLGERPRDDERYQIPEDHSESPLTASELADALGCFWNAAIGSAQSAQDSVGFAVASVMAEGIFAVQTRLHEIAQIKTAPFGEPHK